MLIPRAKLYLNWSIFGLIFFKLLTGKFLKGNETEKFEEDFKNYIGTKHAIATIRARTSLYLLLKTFDLKPDDEVLITSFNVPEVINMIIAANLRPIFVDVDIDTYNLSLDDVRNKITNKTKVIILTHLFGQPCQINELMALAKEHNLITIEDCAQACGAKYQGQKVGSFADAGYFSFNSYKNVTTFYGGMIVTNDDDIADKLKNVINALPYPKKSFILKRMIRDFILWLATSFILFPLTYLLTILFDKNIDKLLSTKVVLLKEIPKSELVKYTNVQAAVGRRQLKNLEIMNEKRINFAKKYLALRNLNLPKTIAKVKNIYHNFPVRNKHREALLQKLFKKGLDLTKGNIKDCSSLDIFKDYQLECPNVASISQQIFYLPVQPQFKEKTIDQVIKKIEAEI